MATLGSENNEPLRIQSISLKFQKQETRTYTLELSCNESNGSKTTKSKLKIDLPKFSADAHRQTRHKLTPPCSLSTNQALVVHVKKKLSFFRTHLIAKKTLSYSDLLRHLGETAAHDEERPLYENDKIEIYLTAGTNIHAKQIVKKEETPPSSGPSSAPAPGSASLPTRAPSPTPASVHAPAPAPTPAPVRTVLAPVPVPQHPSPSPSPFSSHVVNSPALNEEGSGSPTNERQDDGTNSHNTQDEVFISNALEYILGDSDGGDKGINGVTKLSTPPTLQLDIAAHSPRLLVASGSGTENTQPRAVAREAAGLSSNGTQSSSNNPQSNQDLRSSNNNAQSSTGLTNVSPLSQGSQRSSDNSQPDVGMQHPSNARRLTNGSSQSVVDDQQSGIRRKDLNQSPSKEPQRSDAILRSSSGRGPQRNAREDKRSTSNQQHGVESVDVTAQPADSRPKRDRLHQRSSGGSKDTGVTEQPTGGSALPGGKTEQYPGQDKQRLSNDGRPSTTKQQPSEDSVWPPAGLTNGHAPTPAGGGNERSANADKPPPNGNGQSINSGPQHSSQPVRKGTQLSSKEKDTSGSNTHRPSEEQPYSAQESGVKPQFIHQTRPPKTEDTSRTGKDQLHSQGIKGGVGSIDKKQSNEQTSVGNRPDQTAISSTPLGPRSTESDNHPSPSPNPISNIGPGKSSR